MCPGERARSVYALDTRRFARSAVQPEREKQLTLGPGPIQEGGSALVIDEDRPGLLLLGCSRRGGASSFSCPAAVVWPQQRCPQRLQQDVRRYNSRL